MSLKIWSQIRDRIRFKYCGRPQELYEKFIAKVFHPVTGANVLLIQDGKLLTVKKNNFYMIPGGTPEPGEKLEETAIREVKEETGYETEIEDYLGSMPQQGRGAVALFKGEINGGEPKGSIEGEPEFIEIERIGEVNWRFNKDMKPVIKLIESEFNS